MAKPSPRVWSFGSMIEALASKCGWGRQRGRQPADSERGGERGARGSGRYEKDGCGTCSARGETVP